MKIKYVLSGSALVFFVGIILKLFHLPGAGMLLVLSGSTYCITSIVYVILALIKKQERWSASLAGVSILMALGYMFYIMKWPGGGVFIVVGSQFFLIYSMIVGGILISKKQQLPLPILWISMGVGSLFLLFKLLYWPGSQALSVFAILSIVAAVGFLIKFGVKYKTGIIGWTLYSLLVITLAFTSDLNLHYSLGIRGRLPETISPKTYDRHAWLLYQSGKYDEAEEYCKKAIVNANKKEHEFMQIEWGGNEKLEEHLKAIQDRNWKER